MDIKKEKPVWPLYFLIFFLAAVFVYSCIYGKREQQTQLPKSGEEISDSINIDTSGLPQRGGFSCTTNNKAWYSYSTGSGKLSTRVVTIDSQPVRCTKNGFAFNGQVISEQRLLSEIIPPLLKHTAQEHPLVVANDESDYTPTSEKPTFFYLPNTGRSGYACTSDGQALWVTGTDKMYVLHPASKSLRCGSRGGFYIDGHEIDERQLLSIIARL